MLPKLLEQVPAEEPIGSITADGAFDTRTCHAAIALEAPVPEGELTFGHVTQPPCPA